MASEVETSVTAAEAARALRRHDIDAKQQRVAHLLVDCQCDGLLILHPANFRWLTSGAQPVGLQGRDEMPALFFNSQQRWLIASATDTPRFFGEDLDGLGFQLKEWHWTVSREQMLADLVFGRRVACDQPFRECKYTGTFFASERRRLSPYEGDRMADLGLLVAHALEATARNFQWGDTEEEVAGQIAHRLVHHGAEVIAMQVSGDGRLRKYRRRGVAAEAVTRCCNLQVTARSAGLHATAARTVWREPPPADWRAEFDAAVRTRVIHLSASRPGERVALAYEEAQRLLRPTPFEHEWRLAPPVCLTGREPSEGIFLPHAQDRWVAGWAAVWQEHIGGAAVVDTYRLESDGWHVLTATDEWPIRRVNFQGRAFDVADVLVRGE